MTIQKEPINFTFDYNVKKSKIKPTKYTKIFNVLNTIYWIILGFCIGTIMYSAINSPTPSKESYYESKDILAFTYQLNNDIEQELNGKTLEKIAHTKYLDKSFKDMQKIITDIKKENKNITFLPNEATIKEEETDDRSIVYKYNVTMPYMEKKIIDNKEYIFKKDLIYNISQNRHLLVTTDVFINEPK